MWADVAIFDPARIVDRATYEQPQQYAAGVQYVLVNGQVVIDGGRHTGRRPRAILYGPGRKNHIATKQSVRDDERGTAAIQRCCRAGSRHR
jgi:N-acyl-D-aspartate/D-glutamate deacylase